VHCSKLRLLPRVNLLDRQIVGGEERTQLFARNAAEVGENLIFVLALIAPHGNLGAAAAKLRREGAFAGRFFESRVLRGKLVQASGCLVHLFLQSKSGADILVCQSVFTAGRNACPTRREQVCSRLKEYHKEMSPLDAKCE